MKIHCRASQNFVLIFVVFTIATITNVSFAEAEDIIRHSSGAQCITSDSISLLPWRGTQLRDNLSEDTLINNDYRTWFNAQMMPVDGYPVIFLPDHTFSQKD